MDTRGWAAQLGSMAPDLQTWVLFLRTAGILHLMTLGFACITPIPPDWEANLAKLPEVHRRFAQAQNIFIGAVIAASGMVSFIYAPLLAERTTLARVICLGIALWWGGRLFVLPWLKAHRHLRTPALRIGFVLLLAECAIFAAGYGYLALA
jgi:hypothetical protein